MICFTLWFWLLCAFYKRSLKEHIILLSKCTSQLGNKRKHIKLVSSEQASVFFYANPNVICKVNARLFLYQQTKYLELSNCGELLCSALFQCLFDYTSCAWFSGLYAKFKNKIQTTQNKMIHFITKSSPRSHVGQIQRSQVGYLSVDERERAKFLCLSHSAVARAFPGERVADPEGQNVDENLKIWGKIRIIDRNFRKNEESGTPAHPGLWGWLRPCYVMPIRSFMIHVLHIFLIILIRCLKFIDTTQETPHLISDYPKTKKLSFPLFSTVQHMIGIHF